MGERTLTTAALTLAICATLTACGGEPPADSTKPAQTPWPTYVAPTNTVPLYTPPAPKPTDFTLTTKTLSKECFGSAGCNVTYRIKASWTGSLDPAKTYEVSYEVRGVEDGPAVGTIDVTGDSYETSDEEIASTTSRSRKLTVVVTGVEAVG